MLGKLLAVWSERQHVRKVQVMELRAWYRCNLVQWYRSVFCTAARGERKDVTENTQLL